MTYGDPFRILITGSRNWNRPDIIEEAIHDLKNWWPFQWEDVVIVHGGARGADLQAATIAMRLDLQVECHEADWGTFGRAAGHIRNKQMVDAGADCVLAFPMGESKGTRGCMKLAELAGIPIKDYEYKLEENN